MDDSGQRWLERFLTAIIRIPALVRENHLKQKDVFPTEKRKEKKINNLFVSSAYFWNSIYVFQLFGNNRRWRCRRFCHRFLDCRSVAPIRAERMQNSRIVNRRWTWENGFNRNVLHTHKEYISKSSLRRKLFSRVARRNTLNKTDNWIIPINNIYVRVRRKKNIIFFFCKFIKFYRDNFT